MSLSLGAWIARGMPGIRDAVERPREPSPGGFVRTARGAAARRAPARAAARGGPGPRALFVGAGSARQGRAGDPRRSAPRRRTGSRPAFERSATRRSERTSAQRGSAWWCSAIRPELLRSSSTRSDSAEPASAVSTRPHRWTLAGPPQRGEGRSAAPRLRARTTRWHARRRGPGRGSAAVPDRLPGSAPPRARPSAALSEQLTNHAAHARRAASHAARARVLEQPEKAVAAEGLGHEHQGAQERIEVHGWADRVVRARAARGSRPNVAANRRAVERLPRELGRSSAGAEPATPCVRAPPPDARPRARQSALANRRSLRVELVQREPDAVVGQAVLREVVGADLLRAVTALDHAATLVAHGVGLPAAARCPSRRLRRILRALDFVLELAALVLALHDHAGRAGA